MANVRSRAALALTVTGIGVALYAAPIAGAKPVCTTTAPNTTQCETNGSTQIVTTPPNQNTFPWLTYRYGGFFIGFGL